MLTRHCHAPQTASVLHCRPLHGWHHLPLLLLLPPPVVVPPLPLPLLPRVSCAAQALLPAVLLPLLPPAPLPARLLRPRLV